MATETTNAELPDQCTCSSCLQ